MKIKLHKRYQSPKLKDRKRLMHAAKTAADLIFTSDMHEAVTSHPLQIILCGKKKMTELNRKFLDKNDETDVLAFDLRPSSETEENHSEADLPPEPWAELYVNIKLAGDNARFFGTTWDYEIMLYIVHGMLHLNGTPDETPAAQRQMCEQESDIMQNLSSRVEINGIFQQP